VNVSIESARSLQVKISRDGTHFAWARQTNWLGEMTQIEIKHNNFQISGTRALTKIVFPRSNCRESSDWIYDVPTQKITRTLKHRIGVTAQKGIGFQFELNA
jgi:hypothetical protein